MCPQLDVSDKSDQKRKICPTKLDLTDKNYRKPHDLSDKKIVCILLAFSLKMLIMPIRIHQANACTLLFIKYHVVRDICGPTSKCIVLCVE